MFELSRRSSQPAGSIQTQALFTLVFANNQAFYDRIVAVKQQAAHLSPVYPQTYPYRAKAYSRRLPDPGQFGTGM
jgi:hypothetical protein